MSAKKCIICSGDAFTSNKEGEHYCYYHRWHVYKERGWARKKPQKPIKRVSDKQKIVNQSKFTIKQKLIALNGKRCFFCDRLFEHITLAHIIRQNADTKMRDEEENCILSCINCHDVFDNKDFRKLKNVEKVLERMKKLDEKYYHRFITKNKNHEN